MGLAVPAQLHLIEHGEQLLPGLLPTKVLYHLYKPIRQWKKKNVPYSRKYWRELNLAVEPKITIARILADLN